jgi:uncharacterized protein YidB (DUF937 family)
MGLLDSVIGSAVPSGNLAKPLTIALLALLASRAVQGGGIFGSAAKPPEATPAAPTPADHPLGGLGALLQRFSQSGLGNIANSWVGTGSNQPVAPHQLADALGPDALNRLSQQTGLPQQELLAHLSQLLPSVVDKLTPQGRLPTAAEAS